MTHEPCLAWRRRRRCRRCWFCFRPAAAAAGVRPCGFNSLPACLHVCVRVWKESTK